jgi:hypothetical protein
MSWNIRDPYGWDREDRLFFFCAWLVPTGWLAAALLFGPEPIRTFALAVAFPLWLGPTIYAAVKGFRK